jgi:hypothetical protein
VAVWFRWNGYDHCLAMDRYGYPAANFQALYRIVEARRVELRHGTPAMVRRSFAGFQVALPPPKRWPEILGVPDDATPDQIRAAHRARLKDLHPDLAGPVASHAAMAELNHARDEALADRAARAAAA